MQFLMKIFRKINKNVRIFISTLTLTGLLLSAILFFSFSWPILVILIILTYVFTFFSLLDEIEGVEWYLLFVTPVLFMIAFYLFYFLFPGRWLYRLPIVTLFAFGIFAMLRTANIFNVGVEKSLQLYRAAFSMNFFIHTVILYLSFNFLFSMRLDFYFNMLFTMSLTFLLAIEFFWSIKLDLKITREVWIFALLIAVVVGEVVLVLSFLPFIPSIGSLVVTSVYYSLAGLLYSYLDQRFYKETLREYIVVLLFVLLFASISLVRF